jgi:predicted esterase
VTLFPVQGDIESPPGPGIEGFYEGPFYSYYKWPRTVHDDDQSIMNAYEMLDEIIEEDGPFDGVLGFSHGGVVAAGILAHHATTKPYEPPPFRCAIFFSSFPPFRMGDDEIPIFEPGLQDKIRIPTLHIMGEQDFVYKHSRRLFQLCDERSSEALVHTKGHEIPTDAKTVSKMAAAIRDLITRTTFL